MNGLHKVLRDASEAEPLWPLLKRVLMGRTVADSMETVHGPTFTISRQELPLSKANPSRPAAGYIGLYLLLMHATALSSPPVTAWFFVTTRSLLIASATVCAACGKPIVAAVQTRVGGTSLGFLVADGQHAG